MVLTSYNLPASISLTNVDYIPPGITLNTNTNSFYFVSRKGSAVTSYIYYWNPSDGGTVTKLTNSSTNPTNLNGDGGVGYPLLLYANNTLYVITSTAVYYTVMSNNTTITSYSSLFTPTKPSGNNISDIAYNPVTNRLYLFYSSSGVYNRNYDVFTFSSSTTGTLTPFDNFTTTGNARNQALYASFDNNNNAYYSLSNISTPSQNGVFKMTFDASGKIDSQTMFVASTVSTSPVLGILVNNSYNFIVAGMPNAGGGCSYNAYSFNGTLISGGNNITNIGTNVYYQFITIDNQFNMFFSGYAPNNPMTILYRILCFKEDTQILTYDGYKLIQDLRKGDLVKTSQNGYKPIYKIGHSKIIQQSSEDRIKDQLYKCSTENFPEVFEDLVLTGCHCILVDKFKDEKEREEAKKINRINTNNDDDDYITENKYRLPACIDERTTVYEVEGEHTIYHFALENDDYYMNYGVYANGLLVESTSKRFMDETHMNEITPPF
jgi:hypothetical protein